MPVIRCTSGPPGMLPEPSIWRTYHWPLVSFSIDSALNVWMPAGKWPQKMTLCAHRLRTRLAVAFAAWVGSTEGRSAAGAARSRGWRGGLRG